MRTISRAQFLCGNFSAKTPLQRPPWSVSEPLFLELCNSCGACIEHCPTGLLQPGRGAYPKVDFDHAECEFCGNCRTQCKTGALSQIDHPSGQAWDLKAVIDSACLAKHGVICRSCAEHCETGAIRFHWQAGKVPLPIIDAAGCNGCGACYRTCPAQAISLGTANHSSVAANQEEPRP